MIFTFLFSAVIQENISDDEVDFLFSVVVNFNLFIKHGFVYKLIWRVFHAQYRFVLQIRLYKRSRWQMFFKLAILKIFPIFTGKNLCWSLFLIQLQPVTLLKIYSNAVIFL